MESPPHRHFFYSGFSNSKWQLWSWSWSLNLPVLLGLLGLGRELVSFANWTLPCCPRQRGSQARGATCILFKTATSSAYLGFYVQFRHNDWSWVSYLRPQGCVLREADRNCRHVLAMATLRSTRTKRSAEKQLYAGPCRANSESF